MTIFKGQHASVERLCFAYCKFHAIHADGQTHLIKLQVIEGPLVLKYNFW